jgi:hypothetical protein
MHKKRRVGPKLERAYERFLEVPEALMLVVLWFVGAALLGVCALALYLYVSLLAGV